MPISIFRHLRTSERLKCFGMLESICCQATTSSYRNACASINRNYHRDLDGTEIPLMTFSDIVINEGNKIRKAYAKEADAILERFGFNQDGSWPEGKVMPSEILNHPIDYIFLSPSAIMKNRSLSPAPDIIYKEGEYAKPEEGYHPRKNVRRGARIMYSDEDRSEVLEDYIVYINTLKEREPLQMIRHADVIEKNANDIVNIYIDGDLVGKQSDERVPGGKEEREETKSNVKHIEIRVETDDGARYNLTCPDIDEAFRESVALLLESGLSTRYMHFFVDGEKLLKAKIDQYFAPWYHRVFLDEYHIAEKIDTLTSLGIIKDRVPSPWEEPVLYITGPKKGQVRKTPKTALSRTYASMIKTAIHYGNVDEAIDYILHIKPKDIHDSKALSELVEYLNCRREMITCYALRKKAGLKNSSNSSELCNELIVSERQKVDDRMHWCEEGSASLAALSAVFVNQAAETWFTKHQAKFRLYYVEPTQVRRYRYSTKSSAS